MSAKSFVIQRTRVNSLFRFANKGQNSQSVHVVIFDWRCKWCLDKLFPLAGISIFFPVISPFSAAYLSCTPTVWTSSPQSPSPALSEKQRHFSPSWGKHYNLYSVGDSWNASAVKHENAARPETPNNSAEAWTLLWGHQRNKHFIVFMWEWSHWPLWFTQLVTRQSRNWTCNFLIKSRHYTTAPKKKRKNSHCGNMKKSYKTFEKLRRLFTYERYELRFSPA